MDLGIRSHRVSLQRLANKPGNTEKTFGRNNQLLVRNRGKYNQKKSGNI